MLYVSPSVCLWNSYVTGTMLQALDFFGTFVGGHDSIFTRTEVCLILTYLFTCNWAAGAADEKTREKAKFEQFKRSAFFDCTAKLTTPAGIAEGFELVAL